RIIAKFDPHADEVAFARREVRAFVPDAENVDAGVCRPKCDSSAECTQRSAVVPTNTGVPINWALLPIHCANIERSNDPPAGFSSHTTTRSPVAAVAIWGKLKSLKPEPAFVHPRARPEMAPVADRNRT